MSKEKEVLKVEDIEKMDNTVILDVPDYVYVRSKGKLFFPKKTKTATTEILLEEADKSGYKPSKAYQKFLQKVYEEYKKSKEQK